MGLVNSGENRNSMHESDFGKSPERANLPNTGSVHHQMRNYPLLNTKSEKELGIKKINHGYMATFYSNQNSKQRG